MVTASDLYFLYFFTWQIIVLNLLSL
jgi:hypothetical protein